MVEDYPIRITRKPLTPPEKWFDCAICGDEQSTKQIAPPSMHKPPMCYRCTLYWGKGYGRMGTISYGDDMTRMRVYAAMRALSNAASCLKYERKYYAKNSGQNRPDVSPVWVGERNDGPLLRLRGAPGWKDKRPGRNGAGDTGQADLQRFSAVSERHGDPV